MIKSPVEGNQMQYSLELISYDINKGIEDILPRTEKAWRCITIFTEPYLFLSKCPAKELRDMSEGTVLRCEKSRWGLHSPNVLVNVFSIRL